MSPRKRRFPMFLKFLLACLMLASLLIVGGIFMVKEQSQFRNRGNFLVKQLRRYEFYQERMGRLLTGTIEILVADPGLRTTLATAGGDVTEIGKGMFERLSSKNGVQPDVFVIFDAQGKQ
ncbi:MAG: hypothetical protein H0X17_17485, partial [Deltaproteobacteria bacterium]|nr:hypothetical protein [Deltaproteobacteria bacterium]